MRHLSPAVILSAMLNKVLEIRCWWDYLPKRYSNICRTHAFPWQMNQFCPRFSLHFRLSIDIRAFCHSSAAERDYFHQRHAAVDSLPMQTFLQPVSPWLNRPVYTQLTIACLSKIEDLIARRLGVESSPTLHILHFILFYFLPILFFFFFLPQA